MVLTWTFYPKYEERLSSKVTYLPKLDKPGTWGFLHVDSNQAWVCWECFKVFERGDTFAKKDAFERMVRFEPEKYRGADWYAVFRFSNSAKG
jgi:23S rRNA C2498 (ribose-2'-O)-methylase RlmM